jgi:threonine dehydrogenase-like Zn-dependent dehydrogenase
VAGRTLVTLISPDTEIAAAYQAASFPRRPGYAAVFEVLEVGSGVSDLQPGDQVFCMGPHQSYQRKPREEVMPLPQGLRPEEAVFARTMGIGMATLTTTAARPPEQVLVVGLGLVGNVTAQVFAACGHRAARRELASRVGIHRVLADVPADDPVVEGHIGLVIDCSGHEEAVLGGCRVVRKGGEAVLVGVPWRRMADCSCPGRKCHPPQIPVSSPRSVLQS